MAISFQSIADGRIRKSDKLNENLQKLISLFLEPVQNTDDIVEAIRRELSLDNARGVTLDLIGEILNLKRAINWDDETYRFFLRLVNVVRRSKSTYRDIYEVAEILRTESILPVKIIKVFPKSLIIEIPGLLNSQKAFTAKFLLDTVSATTGFNIIIPPVDYFGFEEDPNALGFNDGRISDQILP